MGYSGFSERICTSGHYSAVDVWCEKPGVCECGAPFRFFHGVDQTNGYDESHPSSCRAPKTEIGFDDIWHEDHHGNRYATKRRRYEPHGGDIWITVNSRGCATPPYEDDLAA